jgi:hypothetical protein
MLSNILFHKSPQNIEQWQQISSYHAFTWTERVLTKQIESQKSIRILWALQRKSKVQ